MGALRTENRYLSDQQNFLHDKDAGECSELYREGKTFSIAATINRKKLGFDRSGNIMRLGDVT